MYIALPILQMFLSIGKGVVNTLLYTGVSFFISFFLALFIAVYNHRFNNWLSKLFKIYISLFRGTPVIVQLFIIYFALPQMINIDIPGFTAVIITLSLNSGAYMIEIIRASINAIDKGQFEAAKTLGIPTLSMWKDIILRQVFIMAIPNICNEFTNLLKETAVVSVIGENDILRRANNIGAQTYSYVEPLLIAALYYYILVIIFTQISRLIEKKVRYDSY